MSRVYKMICEKDTHTGRAFGGGGGGGGGGARYSRRTSHNTPVGAHRRGADRSPVTARIENYPGGKSMPTKAKACIALSVTSVYAPPNLKFATVTAAALTCAPYN